MLIETMLLVGLMQAPAAEWTPLFDGKTLAGWTSAGFTNPGEVKVEDGALVLKWGKPLTGANYGGALPKADYEVRFEAQRVSGNDFFATLTFPVGESHATWVLGGWGGDIVGISSIDGWDASENETRAYYNFENGRWYRFRLLVKEDRLQAWIDDERVVNVGIAGREIGLRPGPIRFSLPFGFAAYNASGMIRKIELRRLK
jgi:hypothetical protein